MRRSSLPPARQVKPRHHGEADRGTPVTGAVGSGLALLEPPPEAKAPTPARRADDPPEDLALPRSTSERRTDSPSGSSSPEPASVPTLGKLHDPYPAVPRLRRLFDPRRGWFRRLERDLSHFLSVNFYPRIPGIALPYSAQIARSLTVSEAEIEIAGLERGLDELRILLITDLHAGPFVSPSTIRRAFDRLLSLRPDLILLGGDLTTSRVSEIEAHLPTLRMLIAPLGAYAVLGNHDHYTGHPELLVKHLESAGIRVLDNAAVVLERDGARLVLAGIDDLYQGKPDLAAAFRDAHAQLASDGDRVEPDRAQPPSPRAQEGKAAENPALAASKHHRRASDRWCHETPVLLLSHNPDVLFEASRRGVALVLAGHTHGGQIRVPGLPVLVRQSRYRLDEGRYRVNRTDLVVSRGLGASGIPLRLACPPEAVFLKLRCSLR